MTTTLPPALDAIAHHLDTPNGQITLYQSGNGPPLFLIHSVNAVASAAEMRPLFESLQANYTVYAIDLPGYGLSDRKDIQYTHTIMTDTIKQTANWIAQRHPNQKVHAVALSLSSEFLSRACTLKPELFQSITLISPTGLRKGQRFREPTGTTRMIPWLNHLLREKGWGAFLFKQLTRPSIIRIFLKKTWGSSLIDEQLWDYNCLTAQQANAEYAPLCFLSGVLFSKDIHTVYENIQCPVLMIHGQKGDFKDYSGIRNTSCQGKWEVHSLPTGALPYFEIPEHYLQIQLDFLKRNSNYKP